MPLILRKNLPGETILGLWSIEEDEPFFLEQLALFPEEELQLEGIKGHRRLEWLAGRWLLHLLSERDRRGPCLKDEYGKPYLKDSPFHISISHSRKIAAVMAGPEKVGIDIQLLVPKIGRIAHRFMSRQELDSIEEVHRIEQLHVFWGAKECLYKGYGRRKVDFCRHLLVTPFTYNREGGTTRGRVRLDHLAEEYDIHYELRGNYMLVYAVQKK